MFAAATDGSLGGFSPISTADLNPAKMTVAKDAAKYLITFEATLGSAENV